MCLEGKGNETAAIILQERQVQVAYIKSVKTYGKAASILNLPMANERNLMYTPRQEKDGKSYL